MRTQQAPAARLSPLPLRDPVIQPLALVLCLVLSACVALDEPDDAVLAAPGLRADGAMAAGSSRDLVALLSPVPVRVGAPSMGPVPSHVAPPRIVRPIVPAPSPHLVVVTTQAGGLREGRRAAGTVRGTASYYCNSDGRRGRTSRCTRGHPDVAGDQLFAAIRRDLVARLRGHVVTVRATDTGRTVEVTIIDCNCGPNANLIDLYADALQRLVPVSRGTVHVEVSW